LLSVVRTFRTASVKTSAFMALPHSATAPPQGPRTNQAKKGSAARGDISVHARTRTNVLLRTLDVRQDPKKEEVIRNVEQRSNSIRSGGQRPPHFQAPGTEQLSWGGKGFPKVDASMEVDYPDTKLVSTATLAGVVVYGIGKPAPGSTGIICCYACKDRSEAVDSSKGALARHESSRHDEVCDGGKGG